MRDDSIPFNDSQRTLNKGLKSPNDSPSTLTAIGSIRGNVCVCGFIICFTAYLIIVCVLNYQRNLLSIVYKFLRPLLSAICSQTAVKRYLTVVKKSRIVAHVLSLRALNRALGTMVWDPSAQAL